jgi:transposase
LDAGTMRVFIEADAPRVRCPDHGVTVAAVPWARHAAGHTRAFDDEVAWLVTHCSKSAVVELMRVAWRSVGAIAGRRRGQHPDPFDGLVRIGIDEISYRRPQISDGRRRPRTAAPARSHRHDRARFARLSIS